MKVLKFLAGFAALLAVGIVAAGLMLEGPYTVERSTTVKATPEQVLAYAGDFSNWNEWTVWTKEAYPDMTVEHPGATVGEGAIQKWNDGSMEGQMEITAFQPDSHLEYLLDMDHGSWQMRCRIAAVLVDSGSVVTWTCGGDSGRNPINRIMMAIFKPMIGEDFQNGLDKLAARFESSG